ncbi:MAG: rhodanese-like domain-containing protein [Saprospiraceae bacterium]
MNDIDVTELKQKLDNQENFVFIDVREQHEYDEYNLGATLMPLSQFPSYIPNLYNHKDDEIVVHCRSGARSGAVKQTLEQLGFTKVRNLLGGVMEWQRRF